MNAILVEPEVESSVPPRRGPRILQVLPELNEGGVERGTGDIATFLAREGWMPLVASAGGASEQRLAAAGVEVLRLPLQSKNPVVVHRNIGRLQRLIEEYDVDLVHARSRAPAWSAYYAAKRCKVPFVTTFHGLYSGSDRWLKRRYNAIMASGDRVIAISEFIAAHLREVFGVGSDRLRIVRRGVDLDEFDPARVDMNVCQDLRRRWGVPEGSRVVMLPGRVSRRKGHRYLVEALAKLRRDDVVCLMVGGFEPESGYVRELEKLIGETGQRERVRLVGPSDRMAEALMLADVVVIPSVDPPEAFGRVSVEAQAMGRPVIVSDNGGLGETMMPASTGWLVPSADVGALSEALALALAMPEESRERLVRRARDFVVQHYSVTQMARRTLAVYRELLDARPHRCDRAAPGRAGTPLDNGLRPAR